MRLVSQNGNVDIPYEQAHILCNMECVMARVGNYEYTLGKYSDKDKTLKVMEMVRSAYCGLPIIMRNCEISDEVLEKLKDWKKQGIVFHNVEAKRSVEYVDNTYFQFPKDEDVEVQDE